MAVAMRSLAVVRHAPGNARALLLRCVQAMKRSQENNSQTTRKSLGRQHTMGRKYLRKIPATLWITLLAAALIFFSGVRAQNSTGAPQMLKGEGPLNDWSHERPG